MAINVKIMDKIVVKTKQDFKARVALTTILEEESEGLGNYKEFYKKVISDSIEEEDEDDEN